jgi:hypothetical protein
MNRRLHVRYASIKNHHGSLVPVVATIKWDGKRLSICGVEGPKANGDAYGSCGQVSESADHVDRAIFYKRLMEVWNRWHLNDMKAGSPVQEAWLRANPLKVEYPQSYYTEACLALHNVGLHPDSDGYKYGSAWKHEEVPQSVIEWLFNLPPYESLPTCWARD